MRLFSHGCETRQAAYLAWADRLDARSRIALEAHALSCVECADALRNGRRVDAALRGAFSPLRERRTIVAPGRVRLAVGPRRTATNPWLRVPRFFGRLAEVAVMVGVTLFAVGTTVDPLTHQAGTAPSSHSAVQGYFSAQPPLADIDYLRWLRLNRPDDSSTSSDQTRLPMGGRFDGDAPEIQKGLGASPR